MSEIPTRTVEISLVQAMQFVATGEEGVSVSVDSSPQFGGNGQGMSPMGLMLVALGSCTGMDVITILRKKRQDITSYRVEVTGTMAPEIPRVYTAIAIRHVVTGRGVVTEAVERAIALSEESYCPAHRMLSKAATITSSYVVVEAPPLD